MMNRLTIIFVFTILVFVSACKGSKESTDTTVNSADMISDAERAAMNKNEAEESQVEVPEENLENKDLEKERKELRKMKTEILALAAHGNCEEGGCETLGFGSKPCGGPWSYLVFPANNPHAEKLSLKVEAYNKKEHQMNLKYELSSNCLYEEPPVVDCVEGRCEIVKQ